MPEGVQVPISAVDETSPAFASAQTKVQAFQAAATGSFTEARGAAKLFSEELGLGMNRELLRAVAGSQLLQGALSAALPVGLAIGFAEVFAKVPELIGHAADELMGFDEVAKKAMADAVSANEKIFKSFTDVAEGYHLLAAMRKEQDDAQKKSVLPAGPTSWAKNLLGPAGGVWDYVSTVQSNMAEKQKTLNALMKDNDMIVQRIGEDARKNADDMQKAAEKSAEEAQRAYNSWVGAIEGASKSSSALLGKGDSPAQKELAAISEQLALWYKISQAHAGINEIANKYTGELLKQKGLIEAQAAADRANPLRNLGPASFPNLGGGGAATYTGSAAAMNLYKVQTDINERWKETAKVLDSITTPAQKYEASMEVLNELLMKGTINVQQFDAAAAQAAATLDKKDLAEQAKIWHELGSEIGRSVEGALSFQESWSQAFKSILADIAKAILQFYVFRSLSESFGGAGAGGTFLGNLFGGMAGLSGHASGGFIPPGGMGWVGESGPELAFGGSSGLSITPNGALGGVTQVFQLTGCIVTDDVVRRAEMAGALQATHKSAVRDSIAATADLKVRR